MLGRWIGVVLMAATMDVLPLQVSAAKEVKTQYGIVQDAEFQRLWQAANPIPVWSG